MGTNQTACGKAPPSLTGGYAVLRTAFTHLKMISAVLGKRRICSTRSFGFLHQFGGFGGREAWTKKGGTPGPSLSGSPGADVLGSVASPPHRSGWNGAAVGDTRMMAAPRRGRTQQAGPTRQSAAQRRCWQGFLCARPGPAHPPHPLPEAE